LGNVDEETRRLAKKRKQAKLEVAFDGELVRSIGAQRRDRIDVRGAPRRKERRPDTSR
jgi:hypothetical protein